MRERSKIFRQARPAERKAGLQVGGGEIELAILAESRHHFGGINLQWPAHGSDLIRERNLHRMKCIARVFDHLGGSQRHETRPDVQGAVQRGNALSRRDIITAGDEQRRLHEIMDCAAFTEEFGIRDDAKAREMAQRPDDVFFAGPWEDSAADSKQQRLATMGKQRFDFANNPAELLEPEAAIPF